MEPSTLFNAKSSPIHEANGGLPHTNALRSVISHKLSDWTLLSAQEHPFEAMKASSQREKECPFGLLSLFECMWKYLIGVRESGYA